MKNLAFLMSFGLVGLLCSTARAQVVYSYYAPTPVTTYAAPEVVAPVTTYYAPAVAAPVTTYYAPAVTTAYYAPAVTSAYYAPAVTYPAYYPVYYRRGLFRRWY